jgi:mono/diheme cytochrome c family protein
MASIRFFVGACAVLSAFIASSVQAGPSAGGETYMRAGCFACHGEMGYGGAGPRFRNDKLLAADDYVIGQILLGRGIMPSFAHKLDDQQIAAVASYIRNSWGNDFGPVSADQVAKARKQFLASDQNQAKTTQ